VVIICIIDLANRLALAVTLVPVPPLRLSLSELGMTLLIYPIVVGVTHWVMGVRKTAPGDLDALGQRV
jgi:rod shape-determining protein MreD